MPRPRRLTAAGRGARALRLACAALGGILACAAALTGGCTLFVPGEPTNIRCLEEGAIGPPACPSGSFCLDGMCRHGPPALGQPCGLDGVCAPGDVCFDLGSVGLLDQDLCSHACCSSADCGAATDLVCAALGPGKMCVPAALWGREPPLPDAGFAGEPCKTGSECRSGVCKDERACEDTCCSDAECGVFAGVCRDDGAGWTCGSVPADAKPFLEPCNGDADCASGLCVTWADGSARCSRPCCSSDECGLMKNGAALDSLLCVSAPHGATLVHACAAVAQGAADRALGEPCDDPGQCRGGRCIEVGPSGAKVCSDVCCSDASCGAPHLFACAPVNPSASAFELHCVAR